MKRSRFLIPIALLAVLFGSCSENPQEPVSESAPTAPPAAVSLGGFFDYMELLNSLDYEELSGVVQPGFGVILFQEAETWPRNCTFGLMVPSAALDSTEGPVNFTLRFPTYASYRAHPELADRLIVRLGPEGVVFDADLTVYGVWMPWGQVPPEWEYYYLCMDGETLEHCEVGDADAAYIPSTKRWHLSFSADHFSDWEFGGKYPPPPPEP
jgi:hypothetical protein